MARKSTLLRIMAGVDSEIEGEARPQPGIRIGFLPQEPRLDPAKDVRGNVEEAVAETKPHSPARRGLRRYADPDADFDALAKEQAELENLIQAQDAHNLDRTLEIAADALRLPPWETDVSKLSAARSAACAVPFAAGRSGHAAARRADQPRSMRNRSPGSSTSCRTIRAL